MKNKKITILLSTILAILLIVAVILSLSKKDEQITIPASDESIISDSLQSSRFGFLDAHGQGMPTLYNEWKENFDLDLIQESSSLIQEIGIGWTRISFVYPSRKLNEYSQKKFDQAKKDNLNFFATILIEEKDYQNPNYTNWLESIVSSHPEIKHWQIQNEIGRRNRFEDYKKYISLLQISSSTIKKTCDSCTVTMGSFMPNISEQYYNNIIKYGDDYVDAYDFHIFSKEELEIFKDFSSRVSKPIFVTEMATYSDSPNPLGSKNLKTQTETEQASTLLKWYVQAFEYGADYIFWSQFVEWYKFQGRADGFFDFSGIVYNGMCSSPSTSDVCSDTSRDKGVLVKKEAFYALKTLIEKIDNFNSIEKISEGQYVLRTNHGDVYVLWCDSGNCSLPSEISGEVTLTDHLGNEIKKEASQIFLNQIPVFIEIE